MPQCSVIGCGQKRLSRNKITFHRLPKIEEKKRKWLENLGEENVNVTSRTIYVCSLHFDESSFKNNILKEDAMPSKILMVCRMCLATGVKLLSIKKHKLEQAYELLTGILPFNETLPQQLCMECTQRLINYDKLRDRSLKAHSLLMELMLNDADLNINNIKSIDRGQHELTSVLKQKVYEPNHYDTYIDYDVIETKKLEETSEHTDIQPFTYDIDIQKDLPTADVKTETNEEIIEEIFTESKENGFDDDTDYMATRDYSTDDSLPLLAPKKKKKAKLKKNNQKPAEPKIDRRRKPFLNGNLKESLFTITDLTFEEQVAEIQKRKESSNFKNSMFKCMECFKGFLDEDAYNSHMTRHTDQCGEYECDICKIHFKHPHALRKHITAHHTQRFCCNQCPYITTHRQTARLHERWHKGTQYQCPHCQDIFVKFSTYMGHIRIKHPSDFVCVLCGYSFVSEKGIELHKKLKHRLDDGLIPEDGPLCELCNIRFVSEEAYRRHLHVSARHNNSEVESKESKRKARRTREIQEDEEKRKEYQPRLRKVEGPIPCEQCGLQLEDSRAYHSHFRRMHPDKNRTKYPSMKSPCMCEVCGRMFQSYALLKDHRWTHTGERPFACEACGKSFRMKQRLVAHRHVHSQLRATYGCSLCDKTFSSQSNRQRHMFIHTGLKPFKCEMCGKCFKHVSEKRAHVTYVHLKKPWPKRARAKRRDASGLQPAGELEEGAGDEHAHEHAWPDHKQPCYHLKM